MADPPDADVSVGLQTGQCLIPGVFQVYSSASSCPLALVTVTFCDFEHSSTSCDGKGPLQMMQIARSWRVAIAGLAVGVVGVLGS
ncbi:MAG: hypothetical protein WA415_09760, partial [Mycobacterium sp.]